VVERNCPRIDNNSRQASSFVADGFTYTPGGLEHSPSHLPAGIVSDILGPDTKSWFWLSRGFLYTFFCVGATREVPNPAIEYISLSNIGFGISVRLYTHDRSRSITIVYLLRYWN